MDPSANPPIVPQDQAAAPVSLAQPLAQTVSQTQPQTIGTPTKTKEAGPVSQESTAPFEVVGTDAIEKEPLPPEVESWMEKVSRDAGGERPPEIVVADKTAQAPTNTYTNQTVFVLPLGDLEFKRGLHSSVSDSVRWLAEWCKKVMKKLGNQAALQ